jgi:Catalase
MSDLWQIDAELGEVLQPREQEIAQKISAIIARGVCEQFSREGAPARRDVHSRAHGCVKAEFQVEEALPAHLAQGVFVPGVTYPAWIRFSNFASKLTVPDTKGDVRAMAIKLLDVPGDKILEDARQANTQDFILLNSPVFAAYDAAGYLAFIERQASANPIARLCAPVALGLKGALIGMKMQTSRIANPLAIRYWSVVPFRLGDVPQKQAVKFSAIPHLAAAPIPVRPGPQFLRAAMSDCLKTEAVKFDFLVQPRTSGAMSVEDSRVEWKEAEAPFHKVATITIPAQEFATAARDRLAENLAFNPWHGVPQHRPLGSVNRTRRVVYQTVSELRRHFNDVSLQEPAG